MTNLIGFHFQNPIPDWPEAVAMLPDGTPVKVFQVQQAREIKAINPGVKVIFRFWDDENQIFGGTWEDNANAARAFYRRWLDGTFMELAQYVDYFEGWNEFLANSQTQQEIDDRIMSVKAKIEVWNTDYQHNPKLSHMSGIFANAAVGNDIPWQMASDVYDNGHVLGYHPYIPMWHDNDKNAWIMPDEWNFYSGRWAAMDRDFRSRGIYVDWMGTEFGLVRAEGYHLMPGDGWVDKRLWGGKNVAETLNVYTDYWVNNTASWNYPHADRYLGSVIFTSAIDGWPGFQLRQPQLGEFAAALAAFTPSTVPVPPTPEPEPDPPTPPKPEPEVRRYSRVSVLLHPDTDQEWGIHAIRGTIDKRSTVGYSADDAGIDAPELTSRTVIVVNEKLWDNISGLKWWYDLHYPGVVYVAIDAATPGELEQKLRGM